MGTALLPLGNAVRELCPAPVIAHTPAASSVASVKSTPRRPRGSGTRASESSSPDGTTFPAGASEGTAANKTNVEMMG